MKNDLITLSEALNMSSQTALSSHGPFIDLKPLLELPITGWKKR